MTLSPSASLEIHSRARIRLPSSLCKPSLRTYFDWDDSGNDDYANRPILLDLFAGGSGAAMGYFLAGFRVVGVDTKPQPHYPFEFHQADALTYPLDGFDAYHASPPCQAYSRLRTMENAGKHPKLVEPVRERLITTGKVYVIENVPGAPLLNAFTLCGSAFGLQTPKGYQLRRHRLFETNVEILFIPPCQHGRKVIGLFGNKARDTGQEKRHYSQNKQTRGAPVGVVLPNTDGLIALGTSWMNIKEACQAIPPAYTEYIGKFLMQSLHSVVKEK